MQTKRNVVEMGGSNYSLEIGRISTQWVDSGCFRYSALLRVNELGLKEQGGNWSEESILEAENVINVGKLLGLSFEGPESESMEVQEIMELEAEEVGHDVGVDKGSFQGGSNGGLEVDS